MAKIGYETLEILSALSQFLPSNAGWVKTSIHRPAFSTYSVIKLVVGHVMEAS